jgi:histidinol dehydrogenase
MNDKKLSRSQLRKQREELEAQNAKEVSKIERSFDKKEEQIDNFYRKQKKKQEKKKIKKSRVVEKQKADRRGYYLNIAIAVVFALSLLLIILIFWGP